MKKNRNVVFQLKLTYKFNNDEKRIDIERLDYLTPNSTEIYVREGDTIYVKDNDYLYINQLIKESTSGIKSYATVSGNVELENGIIKVNNDKSDSSFVSEEALDDIKDVKKEEKKVPETVGTQKKESNNVEAKGFSDLKDFAKNIALYEYKGLYYLVFTNIHIDFTYTNLFYTSISEFSNLISNSLVFKSKLEEHGKVIFKANAIKNGIKYFVNI